MPALQLTSLGAAKIRKLWAGRHNVVQDLIIRQSVILESCLPLVGNER